MITAATLDNVLADLREDLLTLALLDAMKWTAEPGSRVPGQPTRRSDQTWMAMFDRAALAQSVSADEIEDFLTTFRLQRAGWQYDRVAAVVTAWVQDAVAGVDAAALVLGRMRQLRGAIVGRPSDQLSAASKLSYFANPEHRVFILDQHAARAVRLRNLPRPLSATPETAAEERARLTAPRSYRNHEYGEYVGDATCCLERERLRGDFGQALQAFERFLDRRGGNMLGDAGRRTHLGDFVARRLLDKLLYWEGWLIKKAFDIEDRGDAWRLAPAAVAECLRRIPEEERQKIRACLEDSGYV